MHHLFWSKHGAKRENGIATCDVIILMGEWPLRTVKLSWLRMKMLESLLADRDQSPTKKIFAIIVLKRDFIKTFSDVRAFWKTSTSGSSCTSCCRPLAIFIPETWYIEIRNRQIFFSTLPAIAKYEKNCRVLWSSNLIRMLDKTLIKRVKSTSA